MGSGCSCPVQPDGPPSLRRKWETPTTAVRLSECFSVGEIDMGKKERYAYTPHLHGRILLSARWSRNPPPGPDPRRGLVPAVYCTDPSNVIINLSITDKSYKYRSC